MAQPFTAKWKVEQLYTIDGLTHRADYFLQVPTFSGGDYQFPRSGGGAITGQNAINDLYTATSFTWPAAVAAGSATLFEKVGLAWVIRKVYTPTFTNHAANTYVKANQHTLTLFDASFYKLRVQISEAAANGDPSKFFSVATVSPTQVLDWAREFSPADFTLTSAPALWVSSRSEHFIQGFTRLSIWRNRKLARRRGV